ncbi:MAG: hypothetical protein EPN48_16560 [Microbacteriaceae bacterium]|nr:MAG: hypothetical protein EPN48_16560 [Microbacteriaceae bacterium]
MTSELTPEERAVVAELVGQDILQLDLAALENSVCDFRRGMLDLRASFGALQASSTARDRSSRDE